MRVERAEGKIARTDCCGKGVEEEDDLLRNLWLLFVPGRAAKKQMRLGPATQAALLSWTF
jgi:hypothetical protein